MSLMPAAALLHPPGAGQRARCVGGGARLDRPRPRLSDAEHAHLTRLASPKRQKKQTAGRPQQVRGGLRQLLAAIEGVPAHVTGRRSDFLARNGTASAVDWGTPPLERGASSKETG
ncbi:hypothetical protein GCM10010344_15280 [Streptomyces bluensis]|nr:hypothetical protein GCM10010344_15280 [Streptomyces bluensis]